MDDLPRTRRSLLVSGVLAGGIALSGCLRLAGGGTPTTTQTQTIVEGAPTARFSFSYDQNGGNGDGSLRIQFGQGDPIQAGNLQIRSSEGETATWNMLGSTTESATDAVRQGDTARIDSTVVNWPSDVREGESIKIIFLGENDSPTTLDTFRAEETQSESTTTSSQGTKSSQFYDGFEDGDLSNEPQWNRKLGPHAAEVVDSRAFNGDFSLKTTDSGVQEHGRLVGPTFDNTDLRNGDQFSFWFLRPTRNGNFFYKLEGPEGHASLKFDGPRENVVVDTTENDAAVNLTSPGEFPIETWVEGELTVNTSNDEVRFRVIDETGSELGKTSLAAQTDFEHVFLSIGTSDGGDAFWDDLAFAPGQNSNLIDGFEGGDYSRWDVYLNETAEIKVVQDGIRGQNALRVVTPEEQTDLAGNAEPTSLATPVDRISGGDSVSTWIRGDDIDPNFGALRLSSQSPGASDRNVVIMALTRGQVLTNGNNGMNYNVLWSNPNPDTWYKFVISVEQKDSLQFTVEDRDGNVIESQSRNTPFPNEFDYVVLNAGLRGDAAASTLWFDHVFRS